MRRWIRIMVAFLDRVKRGRAAADAEGEPKAKEAWETED
jgi:hypothetical protein